MCSITSAGQKSLSVAVRWALIVRDQARYHTIEQRPVDVMILGCLNFLDRVVVVCFVSASHSAEADHELLLP